MASELGHIGPIVIRTYTLLLDLAVLISLGVLAWQGYRRDGHAIAWIDAGIGALIGGLLLGRIVHVVIYWTYFSEHLDQTYQLWQGGMDWHGALIGGLIGLALMCRWRSVRFEEAAGIFAVLLPIGALFVFAGCYASSCGHGREVQSLADYPPLIAAELPDLFGVVAPRFASQLYGIVLSMLVLIISLVLARFLKHPTARLGIVLSLLSLGNFGIGFTRGDEIPMLGFLRIDQALDLAVVLIGLMLIVVTLVPFRLYRFYGPVGLTRK